MSSRPQMAPYQVITNGNMSGTITSKVTIIQKISMFAYEISWSGTAPAGTATVQTSNSYSENADGSVKNSGVWTSLPLTGAISGNTGNGILDVDALGSYAVRLQYVPTSGTGTMQAIINGKVS